jgi:exodeoxyribonuclease V alpha subunit
MPRDGGEQLRLPVSEQPARPAEGILEGEVVRVTYENEATGFRVLRVRVPGQAEAETVVGVLPAAPPGTRIRATGRRVTDAKHGAQFRAETLLPLAPSTLEGIERYLGSGLVKGVGPAYARRIVEAFGERTLEVLDREPERLRDVPGLGKSRVAAVVKAWGEHREVGAIMVFLQSHGVSPALAARIYKRFGPKSMRVVSEAPYRLALDVWGIGFKTADAIARAAGVGAGSSERAQAGALQSLHDLAQHGHVYAPVPEIAERAARLLGEEAAPIDAALAALAASGRVCLEELLPGGQAVFLPDLQAAEKRVAERLAVLASPARPLAGVEQAVAAFERAAGIALAPEQRASVEQAARDKVVVITGGPGVGKTTIVRAVLTVFDRAKLKVALAAPTGRAAKRMSEATGRDASTLHRLLEFDPKAGTFGRNRSDPLDVDALVVDETSMVALELADALLAALPDEARLVLVGDVDQLPSIGPGAVLRDVIASGKLPTVRLTRIFRQAEGSAIVVNAHRIHDGEMPVGAAAAGEQFYVLERREPEAAVELVRELVTRRIPDGFSLDPLRDVQVLTPMQRGPVGAIALNQVLQATLNPVGPEVERGSRVLRLGDRVMQLRNDYDRDVFNGDVGRIVEVDAAERRLVVRIDDRDVVYDEGDLDELTLAYATSIHKSQGSEYPAVVVPILMQHFVMLSRNLLYTAVTRGKRLVVLVADPRAVAVALAETRREERRTHLRARLAALVR